MHLHGHFFNIFTEDRHMLAQLIQKDTCLPYDTGPPMPTGPIPYHICREGLDG
jgi:hypothetical protein